MVGAAALKYTHVTESELLDCDTTCGLVEDMIVKLILTHLATSKVLSVLPSDAEAHVRAKLAEYDEDEDKADARGDAAVHGLQNAVTSDDEHDLEDPVGLDHFLPSTGAATGTATTVRAAPAIAPAIAAPDTAAATDTTAAAAAAAAAGAAGAAGTAAAAGTTATIEAASTAAVPAGNSGSGSGRGSNRSGKGRSGSSRPRCNV